MVVTYTRFNSGTHEQNPLGGIPQGQSQDGQMNTVEQGETKMGSFIYSDRISLNPDMIKQFNFTWVCSKTVADASKAIEDSLKTEMINMLVVNYTFKALRTSSRDSQAERSSDARCNGR
jgi:hypothetical protein